MPRCLSACFARLPEVRPSRRFERDAGRDAAMAVSASVYELTTNLWTPGLASRPRLALRSSPSVRLSCVPGRVARSRDYCEHGSEERGGRPVRCVRSGLTRTATEAAAVV
ncbi:hypothetical protein K466DRAFT_668668 [Polyporus arcularius HHB13444]|uniref:Uncharacterized protein n=1 Tax=Polyporus arcularius HHB13444 TaxID=1314778 RepID=A0A5C3NKV0_9APHY|nr:hypothetical protein K466DRAFT_668668 [Polyporus arcularius HHB13444]